MKNLFSKVKLEIFDKKCVDDHLVELIKEYYKYDDGKNLDKEKITNIYSEAGIEKLFDELNQYIQDKFDNNQEFNFEIVDNTIYFSQSGNTVYINNVVSSAFFSFIAAQFYQSYLIDNVTDTYEEESLWIYRYLLFILNEMCFATFGLPVDFPDEESKRAFLELFKDKQNILNISSDMFYTCMAFVLLHEMAHGLLQHPVDGSQENEFQADALAYKILLDFISDIRVGKIESNFKDCFSDYFLLAPLVLLEFYYVVNYVGSFLCETIVLKEDFDLIVKRKEALLEVFYEADIECDENQSYGLYNSYVNGEESFLRSFVASHKQGMLEDLTVKNLKRIMDNE